MQNLTHKKKQMIQDISIFSASAYIAQIAYFLRGFLNASIVGPAMYGLWAALNIILSLSFYVHLGVLQGISREIPYSLGKGDSTRADVVRSNAFGFCLVMSIVAAISVILVSLFFRESLGTAGIAGIVTVSVLIVVQNSVNFYETALTAMKRFSVMALADILFPIMCVILTLIFVAKWKLYGIYVVALFGPSAICLFYYLNTRYRPVLKFKMKEVLGLIRIGFPLMSLLLFPIILFTIDRILIFRFLGATKLGYYALSLFVCKFILCLPLMVGKVIEPRLFHRYGETENIEDLRKYLFVPSRSMTVFMPILIGIVYFGSSFVIRHFMTQYIPSLTPLFILLFGKFFVVFAPTVPSFLTVLNKQHRIVYFYLAAIFLSALLDIIVLKLGYDLTAVALMTAIVSFLLGTSLFIYASSSYLRTWRQHITIYLRLYSPYAYILGLTIILNSVFSTNKVVLLDLAFVIFKILILLVLSIPFILNLNREIRFLEGLALVLKSRWRGLFSRKYASGVSLAGGDR